MLLRPVLAEHVDHILRPDGDELRVEALRPAGMELQYPVRDGVSERVERDAIDPPLVADQFVIRNPVGFDELKVEPHVRFKLWILRKDDERLPVLAPRHPYGAELRGKPRPLRPDLKIMLYALVNILVFEEHLKPRTRADGIVCQRLHYAARIRIVLNLVACAGAEYLADVRVRLRVCGQEIRRAPVLRVVLRSLRRVEPRAHPAHEPPADALPGRCVFLLGRPQFHSAPPPAAIFVIRIGSLLPLRASFDA